MLHSYQKRSVLIIIMNKEEEEIMRKFKTVFMRGGTSKGCLFLRDDLPENQAERDEIFLQVMG